MKNRFFENWFYYYLFPFKSHNFCTKHFSMKVLVFEKPQYVIWNGPPCIIINRNACVLSSPAPFFLSLFFLSSSLFFPFSLYSSVCFYLCMCVYIAYVNTNMKSISRENQHVPFFLVAHSSELAWLYLPLLLWYQLRLSSFHYASCTCGRMNEQASERLKSYWNI